MKITQHGEFAEYQPGTGESVVLHDGRFITARINDRGSTAPGRKLQVIQGKAADVDAEVARLGLTAPTAEQRRLSRLSDDRLAAEQTKADAGKVAIDAEAARRAAKQAEAVEL